MPASPPPSRLERLAERWTLKSFFLFAFVIGALIFPFYGCWIWGLGWLAQLGIKAHLGHGAIDYAGSCVVHVVGGTLALLDDLVYPSAHRQI